MIRKLIRLIILAFIIFVIYGLYTGKYNVFKKYFTSSPLLKENKVLYADGEENINSLNVTLSYTNLIIKESSEFKIETNNKHVKLEQKGDSIKINEEKINVSFNTKDSNLILYIPSDKVFNEINLTAGAGYIEIANINSKKIDLKQGAGKINIKNITILDEAKITGGAGTLNIENGDIYNLNFAMGAGKSSIASLFKGSNKISAGVGELNIKLLSDINDYKIKIKKGLGNTPKVKSEVVQVIKPKISKYHKASHKVLYYMLVDTKYISMYKNTLGYFKERMERVLASEIEYYAENMNGINVADFTTYMLEKEDEYEFLQIILSENGNTSISDDEFTSCVKAILNIYKKEEIEKVKIQIALELDQSNKEKLLGKLIDLKRKCE